MILILHLTGRTALLMAIDNENLEMVRFWIASHPHPHPDPDPYPDPEILILIIMTLITISLILIKHLGGVAAREQSGDERRSAACNQ